MRTRRFYSLDPEVVETIEWIAHAHRRTYGSVIEIAVDMLQKVLIAQGEMPPKPANGNKIKRVQEPVGQ